MSEKVCVAFIAFGLLASGAAMGCAVWAITEANRALRTLKELERPK